MSAKPGGWVRAAVDWAVRWVTAAVGGPARFQVIAVLACVLALDAADKGTVGAVAVELKESLGITNTELGSLTAVSSASAALAVIPVGVLTDRVRRVRLLAASVVLWVLAMLAGGVADSYQWLLLSRLALGAVSATAGPTLSSLIGDFFPPGERARVYGFILSGEMLGVGLGLLVGGNLAHLLSWRAAFCLLALFGILLVIVIARKLPEPTRGGQGRLRPDGHRPDAERDSGTSPSRSDAVHFALTGRGVEPDPGLMLRRDPTRMSMWEAALYVLRIRTNVVLITASAVGYFFFAGLRSFGVLFVDRQYGLTAAAVTGPAVLVGFGALAGVLSGGRIADHLVRRGRLSAHMIVPAVAYLTTAVFFVPALLTTSTATALPFFLVAAGCLAAANPPLDAARLDVVHFRLWGRAESIRTFLRMGAESIAPVTFGFLADVLGSGGATSARGLQYTFLIMLAPLMANAIILLHGRHSYPRDVATAAASEKPRVR
ncbi:MFS transporter [Microbispora sp. NEAU-D428]|uniref:MFS transporter n=1 Tax=Microbispora sitophila TaxID=2771537 RepID=UPI001867498C|nr:MFS transporter [Microbispora sitophila]MBE3015011.1 MFS transporter [Microbispora sitophila]